MRVYSGIVIWLIDSISKETPLPVQKQNAISVVPHWIQYVKFTIKNIQHHTQTLQQSRNTQLCSKPQLTCISGKSAQMAIQTAFTRPLCLML